MNIVSKIRHYIHLDVDVGHGSTQFSQADTHILTLKAVLYRSRSANVFYTFWCKQNTRKRSGNFKKTNALKKSRNRCCTQQARKKHPHAQLFFRTWLIVSNLSDAQSPGTVLNDKKTARLTSFLNFILSATKVGIYWKSSVEDTLFIITIQFNMSRKKAKETEKKKVVCLNMISFCRTLIHSRNERKKRNSRGWMFRWVYIGHRIQASHEACRMGFNPFIIWLFRRLQKYRVRCPKSDGILVIHFVGFGARLFHRRSIEGTFSHG